MVIIVAIVKTIAPLDVKRSSQLYTIELNTSSLILPSDEEPVFRVKLSILRLLQSGHGGAVPVFIEKATLVERPDFKKIQQPYNRMGSNR